MTDMLALVFGVIKDRQAHPRPGSYTNRLLTAGEDEIVKKIGEEIVEVIIAAKGQGDERLISELADLTYHCLVLLAARGLNPDDVAAEFTRTIEIIEASAAAERSLRIPPHLLVLRRNHTVWVSCAFSGCATGMTRK